MEHALATCASRLDLRPGVTVTGLLAGPSALASVPRVRGVRIWTGEESAAEIVVDATGRHSAAAGVAGRPRNGVDIHDRP
jgi:flavin-dependent dehydrogenase